MGFPRALRRIAAGLATFAMLLAALAPAITHALAAANDQHVLWTAVCTADGARLVPVPTDPAGVPVAPKSHQVDHCPFCAPHAPGAALPPSPVPAVPAAFASDPVPVLFLLAPRPLFAWAAAQPRAPPRAS
jgi:hypothetical protein